MSTFTESVVEEAALGWLRGLGYACVNGAVVAPGETVVEVAAVEWFAAVEWPMTHGPEIAIEMLGGEMCEQIINL